jgi:hypothetical protein
MALEEALARLEDMVQAEVALVLLQILGVMAQEEAEPLAAVGIMTRRAPAWWLLIGLPTRIRRSKRF